VREIYDQALFAEQIGLNSAWIGEHHFNLLGVNASRTCCSRSWRCHEAHPPGAGGRAAAGPPSLQVAEDWATLDLLSGGRSTSRPDAATTSRNTRRSTSLRALGRDLRRGLEVVWRAWTEPGRWSHKGAFYQFDDVEVRPRPLQQPLRPTLLLLAADHGAGGQERLEHHLRAVRRRDGLRLARRCRADLRRPVPPGFGRAPRRAMCSYFIHLCDTPEDEAFGRRALIRYFQDALIAAFPSDPKKTPPTYKYFIEIVDILRNMKPESLTSKSVLIGSPQKIIDDLKTIEAAGIAEVILYSTTASSRTPWSRTRCSASWSRSRRRSGMSRRPSTAPTLALDDYLPYLVNRVGVRLVATFARRPPSTACRCRCGASSRRWRSRR